MTRIALRTFDGMMPRINPELLPPSAAQLATNVRVATGALEPWNAPATVLTLSSVPQVQTIYRFGQNISSDTQYWFEFTGDVDVVKGAVDGDTEEKTYWTDGSYPKKTKASMAHGRRAVPHHQPQDGRALALVHDLAVHHSDVHADGHGPRNCNRPPVDPTRLGLRGHLRH